MSQLKFITFDEENAKKHISRLSFSGVKNIVRLLNLGDDWYEVDQRIEDHRRQLIDHIIQNSVKPYQKIRNKVLNVPSTKTKGNRNRWNPKDYHGYKSVVHFIQNGYGSGVNINSQGIILSCAHAVSHDDDEDDECVGKNRVGRTKVIIFPNGHLFECECFKILESEEPDEDLALLRVTKPVFPDYPNQRGEELPYSQISQTDPTKGDPLYLIGNPGSARFSASVSQGKFEGSTTRRRKMASGLGNYIHSCWVYYGFSGSALFNSAGEIVGIHNSWNEFSASKHAVSLPCIKNFVKKN